MNVQQAYNLWAQQYDTNVNRTRDLEAVSLRTVLQNLQGAVLEVGCGTGKNSVWLAQKVRQLLGVDLSPEMLAQAKLKVDCPHASFGLADITNEWTFTTQTFDCVVFSLVLEHVEDLRFVFGEARKKCNPGAWMYVGELHPFKQYLGTKARFDTADGRTEVTCFQHHISDFVSAASASGFQLIQLKEWFDEDDSDAPPRVLSLLFQAVD